MSVPPARALTDQQQHAPLRDGVLHMEELPLAGDPTTAGHHVIRNAGPVVRDAHGAYVISGLIDAGGKP